MTVKGDLVAALQSAGYPHELASDAVKAVIEHMDDPNFADRFARWCSGDDVPSNAMSRYWQVCAFLREMI